MRQQRNVTYYGHSVDHEKLRQTWRGRWALGLNWLAGRLLRRVEYHVMILFGKQYHPDAVPSMIQKFHEENAAPPGRRSSLAAFGPSGVDFARYSEGRKNSPDPIDPREADKTLESIRRLTSAPRQEAYTRGRDEYAVHEVADDIEMVPDSELIT